MGLPDAYHSLRLPTQPASKAGELLPLDWELENCELKDSYC